MQFGRGFLIEYELLGHSPAALSVAPEWVQRDSLCGSQLVAWNSFTSRELSKHSRAREEVAVE